MAGGCDWGCGGRAGLSGGCSDYIYRAQADACFLPIDTALGPAGGGGTDWVAGRGDCLGFEAGLGRRGDGACPGSEGGGGEQGQFWTRAGGGRDVRNGGRQVGRAGDGGSGGAAGRGGVGNGCGTVTCAGAGGRCCARTDDLAAGFDHGGTDWVGEPEAGV